MKPLLVFAVSKDILGQDGEAKMLLELSEIHTVLYELLNKREVKIAGYCIAKFFFLHVYGVTESRSMYMQNIMSVCFSL